MQFAVCISLALTACVRHAAPQAVPLFPAPADLAIVTWNLHGEEGDLQRLVADLRAGGLTAGQPPRAFVLLLQEASAATRADHLHSFFAPAQIVGGAERGNAILSTLPLLEARAIELPRERQRRVAAVASVRVAGTDLLLVNVHLENRASWWKGFLPGDPARARQMEALLAQLPDGPGILGGDLNVMFGTRERAYRAAIERFPDAAGGPPPLTFRERLMLDHVLYRLPAGWDAATLLASSRYGSDHYPVVGLVRAARK